MNEPFIFLCPEVTRKDADILSHWLEDDEVRRYLSDDANISESIAQMLGRVNLPVLTHLFNRNGSFYMVYDKQNGPLGFVRIAVKGAEAEIVVVIGDKKNWGKRLGTSAIRESLKIIFFELRAQRVFARIHPENKRSIRAFTRAGFKFHHKTAALESFEMTMTDYLQMIKMQAKAREKLYITQADKNRLSRLLDEKTYEEAKEAEPIFALDREISKATVVDKTQVQPDVVTMNSRALLQLDGVELEVSLVYPHEADWKKRKVSILSPIGTAILGYREGDTIAWELSEGMSHISIKKVLYQPEAAGHYHL